MSLIFPAAIALWNQASKKLRIPYCKDMLEAEKMLRRHGARKLR